MEEFYIACQNDDMVQVKKLLPDIDLGEALNWCSHAGSLKVVERLLSAGALPSNYSVLWALLNGHDEIFNLQKEYATIDIYIAALKVAAKCGNSARVYFILALVGTCDDILSVYPKLIRQSIYKGHAHILKIFLDVNNVDYAIECGVQACSCAIIKSLLNWYPDYVCSVETLIDAAHKDCIEIMSLLVARAPTPTIVSAFIKALKDEHELAATILVKYLPINCEEINNLIDEAMRRNNISIIKIIVQARADYINIDNTIRNAADNGCDEIVTLLINYTTINFDLVKLLIENDNECGIEHIAKNNFEQLQQILQNNTVSITELLVSEYLENENAIALCIECGLQINCDMVCALVEYECAVVIKRNAETIKELLKDDNNRAEIIQAFNECEYKNDTMVTLLVDYGIEIDDALICALIEENSIDAINSIIKTNPIRMNLFLTTYKKLKQLCIGILKDHAHSMLNLLLNNGWATNHIIIEVLIRANCTKIIERICNSGAFATHNSSSDHIWKIFFCEEERSNNNNAIIKLLLNGRLQISEKYINKFAERNNVEIIKIILDKYPNIKLCLSFLTYVIRIRDWELAKMLVRHNGHTMLKIAVDSRMISNVQILLDLGAHMDAEEIFSNVRIFGYDGHTIRRDYRNVYQRRQPNEEKNYDCNNLNINIQPEDIQFDREIAEYILNAEIAEYMLDTEIANSSSEESSDSVDSNDGNESDESEENDENDENTIKIIMLLIEYGANTKYLNLQVFKMYSKYLVSEQKNLAELLFSTLEGEQQKWMLDDDRLAKLQTVRTKNARNI